MDLDFSKCKTKEDVEKVFEENKPTMDMAKDFVKKMEEASKMPGIQAFIKFLMKLLLMLQTNVNADQ